MTTIIKCNVCGTIIDSRKLNGFIPCVCDTIAVDVDIDIDYNRTIKRIIGNKSDYTEMTVEEYREFIKSITPEDKSGDLSVDKELLDKINSFGCEHIVNFKLYMSLKEKLNLIMEKAEDWNTELDDMQLYL